MNATEQTRFKPLYAAMLRALQLQGKAEKTVEAYARAIRRSADFFDCCPDDLTAEATVSASYSAGAGRLSH